MLCMRSICAVGRAFIRTSADVAQSTAREAVETKSFANASPKLAEYCEKLFAHPDEIADAARARAAALNFPDIHVTKMDALLLEVLTRSSGAKSAVEFGTLVGISSLSIARGLAPGGTLHTFELDARHAAAARATFAAAGLGSNSIRLHEGRALDLVAQIEPLGPFDLVFIDADKPSYPAYVRWAARHLRLGGTVLVDNAFAWGLVAEEPDSPAWAATHRRVKNVQAIAEANALLAAADGAFRSTMLPTGEGMVVGVRVR